MHRVRWAVAGLSLGVLVPPFVAGDSQSMNSIASLRYGKTLERLRAMRSYQRATHEQLLHEPTADVGEYLCMFEASARRAHSPPFVGQAATFEPTPTPMLEGEEIVVSRALGEFDGLHKSGAPHSRVSLLQRLKAIGKSDDPKAPLFLKADASGACMSKTLYMWALCRVFEDGALDKDRTRRVLLQALRYDAFAHDKIIERIDGEYRSMEQRELLLRILAIAAVPAMLVAESTALVLCAPIPLAAGLFGGWLAHKASTYGQASWLSPEIKSAAFPGVWSDVPSEAQTKAQAEQDAQDV